MIFGENRKFSLRAARGKAIESSTNVWMLCPGTRDLPSSGHGVSRESGPVAAAWRRK